MIKPAGFDDRVAAAFEAEVKKRVESYEKTGFATPEEEFLAMQAQRRAEKLTAAKREVEAALSALATDREGREAEMAADAIANLIRVIVEEKP